MTGVQRATGATIRNLHAQDLGAVIEIDAAHTGQRKREYWTHIFDCFLGESAGCGNIAIGVVRDADGGDPAASAVDGYLFGEVRAFEFGSEACGWIFAVAVDKRHLRETLATRMLNECCRRFRAAGVAVVRTMVARTDVPLMSFFRAQGFVGGPFVQLEQTLTDQEREEEGS